MSLSPKRAIIFVIDDQRRHEILKLPLKNPLLVQGPGDPLLNIRRIAVAKTHKQLVVGRKRERIISEWMSEYISLIGQRPGDQRLEFRGIATAKALDHFIVNRKRRIKIVKFLVDISLLRQRPRLRAPEVPAHRYRQNARLPHHRSQLQPHQNR